MLYNYLQHYIGAFFGGIQEACTPCPTNHVYSTHAYMYQVDCVHMNVAIPSCLQKVKLLLRNVSTLVSSAGRLTVENNKEQMVVQNE